MEYVRSKPVLKTAIQWNGENIESVEQFVGEFNVQGEYEPSKELLIKQGSGNFRVALTDWLIREDDRYYAISNRSFRKFYRNESLN